MIEHEKGGNNRRKQDSRIQANNKNNNIYIERDRESNQRGRERQK